MYATTNILMCVSLYIYLQAFLQPIYLNKILHSFAKLLSKVAELVFYCYKTNYP